MKLTNDANGVRYREVGSEDLSKRVWPVLGSDNVEGQHDSIEMSLFNLLDLIRRVDSGPDLRQETSFWCSRGWPSRVDGKRSCVHNDGHEDHHELEENHGECRSLERKMVLLFKYRLQRRWPMIEEVFRKVVQEEELGSQCRRPERYRHLRDKPPMTVCKHMLVTDYARCIAAVTGGLH